MESIDVIASTCIALLIAYFHEGGKAFARKAGKAAWKKCEEIYQTIKIKLHSEKKAQEALINLKANPKDKDNIANFQKELRKILETDTHFLNDIKNHILEAQQVGITVSGSGAVATSGGTAAGKGGIAIGGNVKGNIK